jgi:hypothetical protein
MKLVLSKKQKKEPSFIVLNENAQVYMGLIGGYPEFSDNWDDAKPLYDIDQIKYLKHGTSYKLEIHFT